MKKLLIALLFITLLGCENNQAHTNQSVTAKRIQTPDRSEINSNKVDSGSNSDSKVEKESSSKGLTTDLIEQYEAKETASAKAEQQQKAQLHVLANDDPEYKQLQAQGWINIVIAQVNLQQQKVNQVRTWIDHYQNGQFKEQLMYSTINVPTGTQDISISSAVQQAGTGYETSMLTVQVGSNSSSSEYTYSVKASNSMMSTMLDQRSIELNRTVDISMRAKDDSKHTTMTSNVAETVKNNQEVFILRAKWIGK